MKHIKKNKEIVVFIVRRDSVCCECEKELFRGSFIHLSDKGAFCLSCADMDHLDYLPRGNAALTRRAKKKSKLTAVVLQWSRTRKRYERQGILAEPVAIDRAEEECLNDAELREVRRIKAQVKREETELKYVNEFAGKLRVLFPNCPQRREFQIADFACRKYSGRVGRTSAAKTFSADAIELAVRAHIRHECTDYDELLMQGYERWEARDEVCGRVEEILEQWKGKSKI